MEPPKSRVVVGHPANNRNFLIHAPWRDQWTAMNNSQLKKFRAFSFPFEIAMIRASESREIVHEWSDHSSDLLCARKGSEFEAGGFRQL
jgi:hypothetical protein